MLWFGHQCSGERGESMGGVGGDGVVGVFSLHSQNIFGLWLDVEEETIASNDWIGCNLNSFRSHTFMTVTKND